MWPLDAGGGAVHSISSRPLKMLFNCKFSQDLITSHGALKSNNVWLN
jgi:hypothetical protein